MTTIAQVKQALKPLLDRYSDLALVGRFLVVKPVHHITRGVFVDRSIDKVAFVPDVVTDMLALEPVRRYGFWGWNPERLYDQRVGTWDVTKPETVRAMREHIEVNVLQRLRSIVSLNDYRNYEQGKSKVFSGAFEQLLFPNMMLAAAQVILKQLYSCGQWKCGFMNVSPNFFLNSILLWKLVIGHS